MKVSFKNVSYVSKKHCLFWYVHWLILLHIIVWVYLLQLSILTWMSKCGMSSVLSLCFMRDTFLRLFFCGSPNLRICFDSIRQSKIFCDGVTLLHFATWFGSPCFFQVFLEMVAACYVFHILYKVHLYTERCAAEAYFINLIIMRCSLNSNNHIM